MAIHCTVADAGDAGPHWEGTGFTTDTTDSDQPDSGIMRTDTAANYAKIRGLGTIEMPRHRAVIVLPKDITEAELARFVTWAGVFDLSL